MYIQRQIYKVEKWPAHFCCFLRAKCSLQAPIVIAWQWGSSSSQVVSSVCICTLYENVFPLAEHPVTRVTVANADVFYLFSFDDKLFHQDCSDVSICWRVHYISNESKLLTLGLNATAKCIRLPVIFPFLVALLKCVKRCSVLWIGVK